ncbi:GNAT family N-acetyltransferase [Noviherbaspirillum agri]
MSIRVVAGDWDALRADAQPVRYDVFVVEQKVPLEMEWDEMDPRSLHVVAYDSNGRSIATGRLLPDGHIGRMAVRAEVRGQGVGGAILTVLMDEAKRRGDSAVMLNAQTHAECFYARFGFMREGEEFMEAGIPHIQMRHVFNGMN